MTSPTEIGSHRGMMLPASSGCRPLTAARGSASRLHELPGWARRLPHSTLAGGATAPLASLSAASDPPGHWRPQREFGGALARPLVWRGCQPAKALLLSGSRSGDPSKRARRTPGAGSCAKGNRQASHSTCELSWRSGASLCPWVEDLCSPAPAAAASKCAASPAYVWKPV